MSDLPTPRVEKDSARRISAIWAIPAVAVAIALTLAVQSYMSRGPVIEITFPTASGIEAGKTPLKYRDVEVGRVESIALEATQEQVVVRVRLQNEVADFVDADARFWVVEPRLSVSEVSGLETLLSGAYLQGSWDSEPGEYAFRFAGLEEPPLTPPGTPGRRITLRSPAGATVTPGAPVFFKHVPVGRIESERFSDDGSAVEYQVFVDAPHHRRLTRATKFWNAGGLNVTIGVDGISTGIESLESFLSGGVAFDTLLLVDEVALPEIRDGAVFRLHPNESAAQNSAFAEGTGVRFTVTFSESVRGLREGAPVENDGIRVGEVVEVLASLGDKPGELNIRAIIEIQPARLGVQNVDTAVAAKSIDEGVRKGGLRAQLQAGNLLTGSLFVALVRVPKDAPRSIDFSVEPYPEFPSVKSEIGGLTGSLTQLSDNLAKLPLDDLVRNASRALYDVHVLLSKSDAPVASALASMGDAARAIEASTAELPKLIAALDSAASSAQSALGTFSPGSELYFEAKAAIRELKEAAQAIEALAETVSEKPNALLLGK